MPFGTTLHVSGTDARRSSARAPRARDAAASPARAEPWLEDVFIRLMQQAKDNVAVTPRSRRGSAAGARAEARDARLFSPGARFVASRR